MNTNDAPEAQIVTRLREAEREVASLRAELAAVRAAVDGEPVPTDASELVQAVAGWRASFYREEARANGLSYERSIARAEVRRFGGDPNALPRAGGPWALSPGDYAEDGDRLAAEQASRVTAPEDDGLTDADRDAGWRWETAYGVWHLYTPIGVLVAVVDDEGWVARVRGPETGAAGKRAAVRALRKAGVMGGGR